MFSADRCSCAREWAYRFLLAGIFCVAFSIAAGESFLVFTFAATAYALWKGRQRLALSPVTFFALLFFAIAFVTGAFGLDPA